MLQPRSHQGVPLSLAKARRMLPSGSSEETGPVIQLGPRIWDRTLVVGSGDDETELCETWFLGRAPGREVDTSGLGEESGYVAGHRWWSNLRLQNTCWRRWLWPFCCATCSIVGRQLNPCRSESDVASQPWLTRVPYSGVAIWAHTGNRGLGPIRQPRPPGLRCCQSGTPHRRGPPNEPAFLADRRPRPALLA